MYNYINFKEDLFSFIQNDLYSFHQIDIFDLLNNKPSEEMNEKREHNLKLENKLFSFLNHYFLNHFSEIKFNLDGHQHFSKKVCLESILNIHTSDLFNEIPNILLNKNKIDEILTFDFKRINYEHFSCEKCGSYVYYIFDFNNLEMKLNNSPRNKPCSIDKKEEYKFNLKVPSKKLVFANYFSEILDEDKYDKISINCYKGIVDHANAYASDNIGYMFVGNTCPSVFLKSDKTEIKVGNFDEDYKNEIEDFSEINSVCTDLWAVCFMDYNQFLNLLKENGLKEDNYDDDFFIVNISSEEIEVLSNNVLFKESKDLFFSIKCI